MTEIQGGGDRKGGGRVKQRDWAAAAFTERPREAYNSGQLSAVVLDWPIRSHISVTSILVSVHSQQGDSTHCTKSGHLLSRRFGHRTVQLILCCQCQSLLTVCTIRSKIVVTKSVCVCLCVFVCVCVCVRARARARVRFQVRFSIKFVMAPTF